MTLARVSTPRRAALAVDELSQAQKSAVASEARVTVVQGGPGSGKTEAAVARAARLIGSLRQDPMWVMVLVPSEQRAQDFRARLRRLLAATRCPENVVARSAGCVMALPSQPGGSDAAGPLAGGSPDARVDSAAAALAPSLGLARREDEARLLLVETARRLAREAAGASMTEADWLRRGIGFVEESVRLAQGEALRRLRMLAPSPDAIVGLAAELRRPADVSARARDLRSALDRAWRAGILHRPELERVRGFVDVAAIDLAEATRREVLAAVSRRRLHEAASALLAEPGIGADAMRRGSAAGPEGGRIILEGVRHVIVDDAHDLPADALGLFHLAGPGTSLFITGDQRSAAWRDGALIRFRTLLRDAGRAVVLLEAPRFGAGIGRFANALGTRLWPATEPGGYAPAISRLDCDPSAAESAELWLVRRGDRSAGGESAHAEPIEAARQREARVVAEGVRRLAAESALTATAVVVQHEAARSVFASALRETGVAPERVQVVTLDEALGLEWPTVFVTGLDEPLGGPAPRRGWIDPETGLPVVWPVDETGRRVWPFSSLLLAQRAALARDAGARQRLFQAVARARTRVILSGATRDRPAGGESCVAPIEWLRRQLGVASLASSPSLHRIGESAVRVTVVDGAA